MKKKKAFFITYLTTSSGIVWLIPWLIWKFCGLYISKWTPTERKINAKREFFYAKWAPAMMCAITGLNYTWYLSLKHTPVSVNSVIYNCAAVWRFFFGERERERERENIFLIKTFFFSPY